MTSGQPRMVIHRDQPPENYATTRYSGNTYTYDRDVWDSGYVWAPRADLTQRSYPPYVQGQSQPSETGRRVSMGVGSPLSEGTYFIGVSALYTTPAGAPLSYSIVSRGIGEGDDVGGAPWALPVIPLAFDGGLDAVAAALPRDVSYYKVEVPAGSESWGLSLSADSGDALMAVRKGALPNA